MPCSDDLCWLAHLRRGSDATLIPHVDEQKRRGNATIMLEGIAKSTTRADLMDALLSPRSVCSTERHTQRPARRKLSNGDLGLFGALLIDLVTGTGSRPRPSSTRVRGEWWNSAMVRGRWSTASRGADEVGIVRRRIGLPWTMTRSPRGSGR